MQPSDDFLVLRRRSAFIEYVLIAAFLIVSGGYWYHQVLRSSHFTELADRNRVRNIALAAPRGRIYDREGRLLADNRPSYDIVLIRENSPHTPEETVALLAPGIGSTAEEMMERVNRARRESRFRPIVLKEDVSLEEITFVKAHLYELPEISIELQPRRRYMDAETLSHVLGYVSEINENQLGQAEYIDYRQGDLIGQTGLERQYNAVLRGKDGTRRVIVNSAGREMGKLEEHPYVAGNDLYTTIDLDLQRAASEALGDRVGSAVALDPQTGEVLVMLSKPGFDPNAFVSKLTPSVWNSLISDPRKPLQNRTIQNHYAPGSVFKIFMAAAALESDVVTSLDTYYCPGHATFFGHTFACHKRSGHGTVGLHAAVVNSCNVFFYTVGNALGIDRIARITKTMGLGQKTGIDLPNEDGGLIPSPEWKKRVRREPWYAGETISVSIGQGAVSMTPLQAAYAMGGFGAGGRLKAPHLVNVERLQRLVPNLTSPKSSEYQISPSTVDVVSRAMWGVVNESGTGTRARVEGFDVAGKTGTAQVVGRANANNKDFNDHAWFVGFAPYRNPEIAVAVFVENGGHGGEAAAPVARAILDTYYRKKTGAFGGDPQTVASNRPTVSPLSTTNDGPQN